MIPDNITREDCIKAIQYIDKNPGSVKSGNSRQYVLIYNSKKYPPKRVISTAYKLKTGKVLSHETFNGGPESNNFLGERGFKIEDKRICQPTPIVRNVKDDRKKYNRIYAIQLHEATGMINIKLGVTTNIVGRVNNLKTSCPNLKLRALWRENPELGGRSCEKGVKEIAKRYSRTPTREVYPFSGEEFNVFVRIVNSVLKKAVIPKSLKNISSGVKK